MTQTFVHDGTEVKLTGRRAERTIEKTGKPPKVVAVLVEVTPCDPDGPTWKQWVDEKSLFKVV